MPKRFIKILDFVVVNKTKPSPMRFKPYVRERAEFVEADLENFGSDPTPVLANLLRNAGLLRHDPEKLAQTVKSLI